jgi:1,4-dihydroxy-2-naphthoate octaprenyltransferase
MFFYREAAVRNNLFSSVKLRLTIISFFFIGGIVGGIFYTEIGIQVLLIGSCALILGIIYDNIKLKLRLIHRKYRTNT